MTNSIVKMFPQIWWHVKEALRKFRLVARLVSAFPGLTRCYPVRYVDCREFSGKAVPGVLM